jgi:prophage regulatory protein
MTDRVPSSAHVILRLRQVIARTGLSRSTLYERIQAGDFPTQINLGVRAVGWLESDVDAWIRERLNRSQGNRSRNPAR